MWKVVKEPVSKSENVGTLTLLNDGKIIQKILRTLEETKFVELLQISFEILKPTLNRFLKKIVRNQFLSAVRKQNEREFGLRQRSNE